MKRTSDEPVKNLARRLRTTLLERHNVDLTHCQALEVASTSLGYRSWHDLRHRHPQSVADSLAEPERLVLPWLLPELERLMFDPAPDLIHQPTLPLLVASGDGHVHAVTPTQWPERRAAGATLSPWPLLPPEAQPYVQGPLLNTTSFYWGRGELLHADGMPVTTDDALRADDQGIRIVEWWASLQEAVKGTSHRFRTFYDDNGSLSAVRISRGPERVPRKLKVPDAPLTAIYGIPVADRATTVLSLAHAHSRTQRVWIVDDRELVGDAADALKGKCQVIPLRSEWHLFDDVQHRISEGDVLVLDFTDPGSDRMDTLRMALTRNARVIVSMVASSWFDARSRLASAGVFVDSGVLQRAKWTHARDRFTDGRTSWFPDTTPAPLEPS